MLFPAPYVYVPPAPGQSLACSTSPTIALAQKESGKNHINWSERETLISPNRRWKLDVFPVFGGKDNHSPVQLTDCTDGKTHTIMYLEADADVHWGPDSNSLLIVDEQCSNCSDLLLWGDVESRLHEEKPKVHAKSQVADEILHAVEQRVGSDMDLFHYAVRFVSWQGSGLIASVYVDSAKKNVGPPIAGHEDKVVGHCYGAVIDTKENKLMELIPGSKLRKEYGGSCE